MPLFEYAGTDERGAFVRGELEAAGLVEAADSLRGRGVSTSRLEKKDPGPEGEPLGTADAFAYFNRALAELAGLGIPLPRAIAEIASGLRQGRFRDALTSIEARLREGVPLDEAVGGLPGVFPPHFAWMLKAGMSSGRLPAVLSAVARNAAGFRRVRQALAGALAYPAVIVACGILFSVAFLFVYLPLYEELHRRVGLEPSFSLRALLAVFRSRFWPPVLAGGAALAATLSYLWATTTVLGERLLFRVPLLGRIRRQLFLARFASTLAILTRSNVPLGQAYAVALGASGSREMAAAAGRLAARAAEGAGLADLLRETPGFPSRSAAYLALGEKGGRVPEAAGELADLLTERAAAECETLFIVAVPAALIATGLILFALFVGLVAPYYSFLEKVGR